VPEFAGLIIFADPLLIQDFMIRDSRQYRAAEFAQEPKIAPSRLKAALYRESLQKPLQA